MGATEWRDEELGEFSTVKQANANARFISAARNLLPSLLADHERLQAENARLRGLLVMWVDEGVLGAEGHSDLCKSHVGRECDCPGPETVAALEGK